MKRLVIVALLILVGSLALLPSTRVNASTFQLIQNGGFELGTTPWIASSSGGQQVRSAQQVHSGSYSAHLCGYNWCTDVVRQAVTLPMGLTQSSVSFWLYIASQESASPYCYDQLSVRILDAVTSALISTVFTACNYSAVNGWVPQSLALPSTLNSYAGRQVVVEFRGKTSFYLPTDFFIDDVTLSATTASATSTSVPFVQATTTPTSSPSGSVYIGVLQPNAPQTMSDLMSFQQEVGKNMAIVNFWRTMGGGASTVNTTWLQNVSAQGSVPLITWTPENWDTGVSYSLSTVSGGTLDSYISSFAQQLRTYGKPVLLRWAHEMNGSWFSWGQQPTGYVAAWRHIHDIFTRVGATNVQWVWCPNIWYSSSPTLWSAQQYYPGAGYVDWMALDGYNNPSQRWLTFHQLFDYAYGQLANLSSLPIMIPETGSGEPTALQASQGYRKSTWITDALTSAIPSMPRIKAVLWYNRDTTAAEGCCNWTVQSSSDSLIAFRQSITGYRAQYP